MKHMIILPLLLALCQCGTRIEGTPSDKRFKENVRGLANVLDRIDTIRGVSFDWKDQFATYNYSKRKQGYGVIAQEVQGAFPLLVRSWGKEGYLDVDYYGLVAVLVEAVKELKEKNESLEKRIEKLEKALSEN